MSGPWRVAHHRPAEVRIDEFAQGTPHSEVAWTDCPDKSVRDPFDRPTSTRPKWQSARAKRSLLLASPAKTCSSPKPMAGNCSPASTNPQIGRRWWSIALGHGRKYNF